MGARDPGRDPRALLGLALKQGRVAAGFSRQEDLAASLGFDRSVIAKAETGERLPTRDVLKAWCAACTLDEEFIAQLVRLARASDGPVPSWFETWATAERTATSLRYWSPIIITPVFQTPEYIRALLLPTQTDTSDEAIDALVDARLERAAILDRDDPPDVVAVIDELVLHRLIGSPEIMCEQLMHIVELSERPYVCVQIVPTSAGATAGLSGDINLAGTDGSLEVLHTDAVPEGHTTESRLRIGKAVVVFDRRRGYAMPQEDSRTLMEEVANRWKKQGNTGASRALATTAETV